MHSTTVKKIKEPLTQQHNITSQKTRIPKLAYTVTTSPIRATDKTSQLVRLTVLRHRTVLQFYMYLYICSNDAMYYLPGICISLYLTETVCTPNSFGTKWTAYSPSSTSLISASSVTPPGDVTVAVRSNDVIPNLKRKKILKYVIFTVHHPL